MPKQTLPFTLQSSSTTQAVIRDDEALLASLRSAQLPGRDPAPANRSSTSPRVLLAVFGSACLLALFVIGALVESGTGVWPTRVTTIWSLGDFAVVWPHINSHRAPTADLWLLVALGDPKIFLTSVFAVSVVALRGVSLRIAALCLLGPGLILVVDECVAKPTFFLLFGGHYGFPSGHVTAVTVLCCSALVLVRERFSRLALVFSALVAAALIAAAVVGVVTLGMHPLKDAVGGTLLGLGGMSLFSAAVVSKTCSLHTKAIQAC